MSDVGWGSDHLEPPKKRKIPLWVFGCAGGCMFMIGAAVVATWVGGGMFKRWMAVQSKPELQWSRLAEALPYDARPADFTIARWPVPFLDLWQLESDKQDLVVYVLSAPDRGGVKLWGEWLSTPKEALMFSAQDGEFETSEASLMLQGRELHAVRITRKGGSDKPEAPDPSEIPEPPITPDPPDPSEAPDPKVPATSPLDVIERNKEFHGNGLALDVTPEGSERRVLVWLMRRTAGATVSDEETKTILAPFQIGPGH